MSNIQSKDTLFSVYKETLQSKITSVCNKIGFNDSKVTWIIFNPVNEHGKDVFTKILVGTVGENYGFCIPSKNEVWISTLSIQHNSTISLLETSGIANLLGQRKEDFLASVIIDEITHIQTGCDHGSERYNTQFRQNAAKYYLSPIEYALYISKCSKN